MDVLPKKKYDTIDNVQPLSAVQLTDILRNEFPTFVNQKLGSSLVVEFAHVSDFMNISFHEVINGNAFTVKVSEDSLELTDRTNQDGYNAELIGVQLIDFLTERAG